LALQSAGTANAAYLLRFHVTAKYSIDRRLVTLTVPPKERKDIRIQAQRDLLFCSRPANRLAKETGIEFRDLGVVNFRLGQGVNLLPAGF
jgi:hypothetical protein